MYLYCYISKESTVQHGMGIYIDVIVNVMLIVFQIVGWGRGLADIFSYWRAAGNTR